MLGKNNIYDVIKGPIVTEKSSMLRDDQQKVLISVANWANKNHIVKAVKELFNVSVLKVNTVNVRGKIKRLRNSSGKQKNIKKAYLTLKKGSDVDLFGTVGQETTASE